MIEELIKNARLSSSGLKLLTFQQKTFIVEDWNIFHIVSSVKCSDTMDS
ncbi:MAG: hypothetical protein ACI9UV_001448 [Algoriphagus sp.]|jgi:hypothetical protein